MRVSIALDFKCENAWFVDSGLASAEHCAEQLEIVAAKLRAGITDGPLQDGNGNRIGSFNAITRSK